MEGYTCVYSASDHCFYNAEFHKKFDTIAGYRFSISPYDCSNITLHDDREHQYHMRNNIIVTNDFINGTREIWVKE